MDDPQVPTTPELAVCAAVLTGATHGYAVGTLLAPGGPLGRSWSLSRPLVYRAIDGAVAGGLLAGEVTGQGRGRGRTNLVITAHGRASVEAWLEQPVGGEWDHPEVFLFKYAVLEMLGADLSALVASQRRVLSTASLPATTVDDVWVDMRRAAGRRLLDTLDAAAATPSEAPPALAISARNQIRARVTEIRRSDVMCTVKAATEGVSTVTAAVTSEAVDALGLGTGDVIVAVVKATELVIARP